MTSRHPIRVILADDHAVVRKGIREFLEEAGDIAVIAEAGDGQQALQLARTQRPDVLVLDVQMPEMNGIEVARRIRQEHPEIRVLVLTAYDDEPYVLALLRAGASGYVLKDASASELIEAVRAVHRGQTAVDPAVAHSLVHLLQGGGESDASQRLTDRETEVLRLAAQGLTNKGIGQALSISDRTVQGHLASIYGKLQVGGRTEAVTEALRRGWITVE